MKYSRRAHSRTRHAILCAVVLLLLSAAGAAAEERGGQNWMGVVDILKLPRVWVGAIFCAIGFLLLVRTRLSRNLRLAFLFLIFFTFSVFTLLPFGRFAMGMGLHPSPICTVTKPFVFIENGMSPPIIFWVMLGTIAIFTLVGNKLFCGWVCPIGAAQEAFNRIPVSERWKITLPFKVTNSIRVLLLLLFFSVLFLFGIESYEYFNPFEFLHWGFTIPGIVAFGVVMIAAIFIFRPFCYFICPLGLVTWILEHLSLVKVKLDKERCIDCDICVNESYCPAVRSILDEKRSRPDCHACGRCIELCPEDALKFKK